MIIFIALVVFAVFNALALRHAVIALRNTNHMVPNAWFKALIGGPSTVDELYSPKGRRHRDAAIALSGIGFIVAVILMSFG